MKSLSLLLLLLISMGVLANTPTVVVYEDMGVTSPRQTFCTFLEAERTWGIRSYYKVDHFENLIAKLNTTLDSHNKYLDIEKYWLGMQKNESQRDENSEKYHRLTLDLFKDAGIPQKDVQIDKGHDLIYSTFIQFDGVLARPVYNSNSNRMDLHLIRRFKEVSQKDSLMNRMYDLPVVVKSNGRAFARLYPNENEIALETIERIAQIPREDCPK